MPIKIKPKEATLKLRKQTTEAKKKSARVVNSLKSRVAAAKKR